MADADQEITNVQEVVDRFYWSRGQCCAGCDWWRHFNSSIGECARSAPVSDRERWAMMGIETCSLRPGAGHAVTRREHHCGDFEDSFDWSLLPLPYRRRIGIPL